MQIHDLVQTYASKSDDELLSLATDFADLTLEAQTALQGELARRGLGKTISVAEQDHVSGSTEQQLDPSQASGSHASVGEFTVEVTAVYRGNFWLFVKLI